MDVPLWMHLPCSFIVLQGCSHVARRGRVVGTWWGSGLLAVSPWQSWVSQIRHSQPGGDMQLVCWYMISVGVPTVCIICGQQHLSASHFHNVCKVMGAPQ
jgi:hypothetical protein